MSGSKALDALAKIGGEEWAELTEGQRALVLEEFEALVDAEWEGGQIEAAAHDYLIECIGEGDLEHHARELERIEDDHLRRDGRI